MCLDYLRELSLQPQPDGFVHAFKSSRSMYDYALGPKFIKHTYVENVTYTDFNDVSISALSREEYRCGYHCFLTRDGVDFWTNNGTEKVTGIPMEIKFKLEDVLATGEQIVSQNSYSFTWENLFDVVVVKQFTVIKYLIGDRCVPN